MTTETMDIKNYRLERLKPIMACPDCRGELSFSIDGGTCTSCLSRYPIKNGKIYFIKSPGSVEDALDKTKHVLKRLFGKLYYKIGVAIVAPTYPFNFLKEVKKYANAKEKIVIDVGSGAFRIDDHVICMDMFDYDNVDIVCDITRLPFKEGTVDAFVSRSVLEHVPDPNAVINEIKRCTATGGYSAHLIPFMMPFHASPYDFQRYTHRGALQLFAGWEPIAQFSPFGPVTLLLQSTIEILSSAFSFGNDKVKSMFYLMLCLLLFPVKFLDFPFVRKKALIGIAPSIFTVVRKGDVQ